MPPLTRAALAALLAAAAATPALAQSGQGYGGQGYDRQGYPPSTYDRGAGANGYPAPSASYDRGGYPPSTYGAGAGQPGYDAGRGQPANGGGYDQGGPGAGQAEDPQELARRLNLSASQQGAFDAYRRAFQPDEARQRQEDDDMRRMATLPTPQRLDMARASLARDRADFDRTDAATRNFYAQLSPAQRRTFDQLTAPQMDDGGPDQGGPSPTQPTARPQR